MRIIARKGVWRGEIDMQARFVARSFHLSHVVLRCLCSCVSTRSFKRFNQCIVELVCQ